MKKLLYLVFFFSVFLTGCEKNNTIPADASLFEMSGETAASGVAVGDGPEEFRDAYADYEILVSTSADAIPSQVMPIRNIPFSEDITAMIANFFINGTPMKTDDLCEAEDVSMDGLTTLLSSPSFLREHEVLYRYLLFYWEDGAISRIVSGELNYNETFEVPASTA